MRSHRRFMRELVLWRDNQLPDDRPWSMYPHGDPSKPQTEREVFEQQHAAQLEQVPK